MTTLSRTRIIGNKYNAILAAGIAASTQRASTELYLLSQQRTGNGRMVLNGPYSGAEDSVIDVEVLGGAGGELQASAVVVNGVGNGTLTVSGIDVGAAAQTMSFTLLNAGTSAKPALLDFFGVQLAAKAEGAAGNAVEIAVTRGLTFTNLPFATLEKLLAGSELFDGPQYDWGQPAATGSDIPDGALRMAFSGSPTVHRAWKKWDSGRFIYHIDPPLPYDVLENSRIQEVTGDYTLTIEAGVDTEVYTAVTIYDFLTQIQARSNLAQVLGVVAPDRAPGGQAVTDIPLRTDAHALPVIATPVKANATMRVGTVDPTADTQNITVTCLGRTGTGSAEAWSVSGGVIGALPAATTGVLYTDGPVQFTIDQPPVAVALEANITGKFTPTSREEGEGLPAICFKPLLLGTAAINKEVTFEYRQRPPDECSCSTAVALAVSLQCLGLAADGGGDMDAEYQSRLIDLYEWNAQFVSGNVALVGLDQTDVDIAVSCTGILAEALAEIYQVPAAATAWDGVLAQLIAELAPYINTGPGFSSTVGVAAQPWTPRAFVVGASYLNPVNNHRYTIDSIEIDSVAVNGVPIDATFPTADSAVWLTDGTTFNVTEVTDVVLTVTDVGASRVWGDFAVDRVFDEINPTLGGASNGVKIVVTEIYVDGTPAALPAGTIAWNSDRFDAAGGLTGVTVSGGSVVRLTSTRLAPMPAGATVAVGHEIVNTLNNHCYRVDVVEVATVSVASASARLPVESNVVWTTTGSTFDVTMPAADRTSLVIEVTDAELVVATATSGLSIENGQLRPITYGAIPPAYIQPGLTDEQTYMLQHAADVELIQQQNAQAAALSNAEYARARFTRLVEYFPQKYAAKMDWVRAIAGIPPKGSASSAGSPCWRDYGDSHWWEDTDGFYLPAFTGRPFVSARRMPDGSIVSTREFGFGLVTECGNRLKDGDRITIKIYGTNSQATWSEGDRFVIPLIGAASAPLTGGEDGDPTQTWTVRSSVLGSLADYAYLPSAPAPWVHAPASVLLVPGGIPFEVGDSLSFNIEGGELRWRRDGGAWTTADLYSASPLSLGDGLTLDAQAGAAPSFIDGDTWQFSAVAKYGTQRMRQPRIGQSFAWDGATCTIDIELTADTPLEAVMLAMHDIPLGASVTVRGGLLDATEWTLTAEVRKGIIWAVLPYTPGDPPAEARYLQVVITNAGAGGKIGWLWAGMGWTPTIGPSSMRLKRQHGIAKGSGLNPTGLYRGSGTGGSWVWSLDQGAALLSQNARDLMELVDHCAEQGIEPIAMFPDMLDAVNASVVQVETDEIEMEEFSNWQDDSSNVVSLTLPLRAVLV